MAAPDKKAATLRELRERAQSALAAQRRRIEEVETQLTDRLQAVAQQVAEELAEREQQAAEIEAAEARSLAEAQERHAAERAAWEAERQALAARVEEQRSELMAATGRGERLTSQLAESQDNYDRAMSERDSQLATLVARCENLSQQLDVVRTEHATLLARESDTAAAVDEATLEVTELVAEIEAQAEELLAAKQRHAELELELARLRACEQKFELAMGDVQHLRRRVAQLERQLADRPAATGGDSAELVSLRAERDALADRVAELEVSAERQSAAAPLVAVDDDLQARFEYAVSDLRELKTENQRLQDELRLARTNRASGAVGADNDWESQKRRLLASLEGDDGAPAVAPQERTSIEATIRITDDVVATKDAEIAMLRTQLANGGEQSGGSPMSADVRAAVDADASVLAVREECELLRVQLNEQLRQAELELSVERARIAREQAELADWRIELETLRDTLASETPALPGDKSKPARRRWLDQLGLGGSE